jgi:hypothetical protein
VREGDSNLITRCESKTLGKMEIIREFSKEGMILVRILDLVSPKETKGRSSGQTPFTLRPKQLALIKNNF